MTIVYEQLQSEYMVIKKLKKQTSIIELKLFEESSEQETNKMVARGTVLKAVIIVTTAGYIPRKDNHIEEYKANVKYSIKKVKLGLLQYQLRNHNSTKTFCTI